jgi:hypothetical protein
VLEAVLLLVLLLGAAVAVLQQLGQGLLHVRWPPLLLLA